MSETHEPPRQVHFFICTNYRDPGSSLPCCAARGSEKLLEAFRKEQARRRYPHNLKVSGSTCLTACQCGPTVVVYPEGIWYAAVTENDIEELLDAHLSGTGPVLRLLLPETVNIW